ncbi:hypothetical protein WK22_17635 [Burkholderia multivorans]|nr:hypothetical protein WK22_17635 [Burkholderia multivorans]
MHLSRCVIMQFELSHMLSRISSKPDEKIAAKSRSSADLFTLPFSDIYPRSRSMEIVVASWH